MTDTCYTIGDRIKYKREQFNLSMTQLAKLVNVTHASISQWENGLSKPNAENTNALQKVFGCSVAWLLYGDETPSLAINQTTNIGNIYKIPILSEKNIFNLDFAPTAVINYIVSNKNNVSERCFAYQITNNSMLPIFLIGDTVIISPEKQPETDCFVLVKIGNSLFIRRYILEDTKFSLVPLNPDYSVISNQEQQVKILGVVIEHRSERNR
ncbi:MAG: helix-turn-helix domain-containing protein [Neisseriaceae bacterium]|nr:helix-turn-helix domain-containing protein [Neisseriaceae bacterium]MBR0212496.1 helix-turn-helix domain-containing protein [Alphaproteobacteria bacterium]